MCMLPPFYHLPLGGQAYHLGSLKLFDKLLTDARVDANVLDQLVEEARGVAAGGEEGARSSLVERQVAKRHCCCISDLTIKTDRVHFPHCWVSWHLEDIKLLCLEV